MQVLKEKCIGCGNCTRVCPTGAIQIKNGKAEIDLNKCINCKNCQAVCPVKAIID